MASQRTGALLEEFPIIAGPGWDSDDTQPIPAGQLSSLTAALQATMAADPTLIYWELGRGDNLGGTYNQPFYFDNLEAKIAACRAAADAVNPDIKLVFPYVNGNLTKFNNLLQSGAIDDIDVLGLQLYAWPNFPMPDSWLRPAINGFRSRLDLFGLADASIWITTLGAPNRGNNDPNGFFGYPPASIQIPGLERGEAANYLVRAHVIAQGRDVERVYVNGYEDGNDDIESLFSHLGLRSFNDDGTQGFPKPAYAAYATMIQELDGREYIGFDEPIPGLHVHEFGALNGDETGRLVAWFESPNFDVVPWGDIRNGLAANRIEAAISMYGTPQTLSVLGAVPHRRAHDLAHRRAAQPAALRRDQPSRRRERRSVQPLHHRSGRQPPQRRDRSALLPLGLHRGVFGLHPPPHAVGLRPHRAGRPPLPAHEPVPARRLPLRRTPRRGLDRRSRRPTHLPVGQLHRALIGEAASR